MAFQFQCSCSKQYMLDESCLGMQLRCNACGRQHLLNPAAPRRFGLKLVAALAATLGLLLATAAGATYWYSEQDDETTRAVAAAVPCSPVAVVTPTPRPTPAPTPTPTPMPTPVVTDDGDDEITLPRPDSSGGQMVDGRIEIDTVGDARVSVELRMPVARYTAFKVANPNIAVLRRRLGLNSGGCGLEAHDVGGSYEDGKSTVALRWGTRGLARRVSASGWEMPVSAPGDLRPVAVKGSRVYYMLSIPSPTGAINGVWAIRLPRGCKQVKALSGPTRVAFEMPAGSERSGTETSAQLTVSAREFLITCLAKLYGDRKFADMWLARAVFKNTGSRAVTDYRVRFRLAEYSDDWSPWHTSARVVPGQTVVDAYFPTLNIEKLARLENARQAEVTIESRYRRADGREVTETKTARVQVLCRNDVMFTDIKREDRLNWQDENTLCNRTMAALTTHTDPVIQKVASQISRGGGNCINDEAAVRFLETLFAFMRANLNYRTPSSTVAGAVEMQHVKYPRDVLRDKAGTCIDLAIFMAAMCRAVGLEPVVFNVPGHAFMGVKLPSGRLMPIESTAFSRPLRDAVAHAAKELDERSRRGQVVVADIAALHGQGVQPIDLPAVADTALADWGIRFDDGSRASTTERPTPPSGGDRPTPPSGGDRPAVKALVWKADINSGAARKLLVLVMKTDGTYAQGIADQDGKNFRVRHKGRFKLEGRLERPTDTAQLTLEGDDGGVERARIQFPALGRMTYTVTHCSRRPANVGVRLNFTLVTP